MRLAIQARDLDHTRIDGTRVYLKELLARFGKLAPETDFLLYHRNDFNPALAPPTFPRYREKKVRASYAWMQTGFAWELFRSRPDKLFLPIQAAPLFLPKDLEVTATIHDLAFKRYPETFPKKLLFKLNMLLAVALKRADKLIAVSQATKKDILTYFPHVSEDRIQVIYHGFNARHYREKLSPEAVGQVCGTHGLEPGEYLLYVGALQPRKNLARLIRAFEITRERHSEMKLVLVGEPAWLARNIFEAKARSRFRNDIHFVGQTNFMDLRAWYQGARVFAFPSLYEGFGIPILEAFASRVPVLTADNSSLSEVAGDAALYADAENVDDIATKLSELWNNESLRAALVKKGEAQLIKFSWDTCAQETLEYILS